MGECSDILLPILLLVSLLHECVAVLTHSSQKHELEGQGREVVMEEENSGEEEVGGVVYQPSHYQYTAAGPPVTEVSCCAKHKCDTGRGYKGGL